MAEIKRKAPSNRKASQIVLLIIMAAAVVWSVSPLTSRLQQNEELATLRAERRQTAAENRQLRADIKKLRGDNDHIEMLARKNLGLVKANEEAYVVIEPELKSRPAPKEVKTEDWWPKLVKSIKTLLPGGRAGE